MSDLILSGSHELGRTRLDEDIAILEGMLIYPSGTYFEKDVCGQYYELIQLCHFGLTDLVERITDHNNTICLRIADRIYENQRPDEYGLICDGEMDEDELVTEIQDNIFEQIEHDYGCSHRNITVGVVDTLCKKGLSALMDIDHDRKLLINDCQNVLIKSINTMQIIDAASSVGIAFDDSMTVARRGF